ncbi:MAG: hypothetical protein H6622_11220 [Halobacteriovoraceae bacterium]|nr:hypothetical protein [Halobacteriovoraceae bacterium]
MPNHLDVEKERLTVFEFFFKYYSFFALILSLLFLVLFNDLVFIISKENFLTYFSLFVLAWVLCDFSITLFANQKSIHGLLLKRDDLKMRSLHIKLPYLEGIFLTNYKHFLESHGKSSFITKLIVSLIFYILYFFLFYFILINFIDFFKYLLPLIVAFFGPRIGAFLASKRISRSIELNLFVDEIYLKYNLLTIGDLYILTLKNE